MPAELDAGLSVEIRTGRPTFVLPDWASRAGAGGHRPHLVIFGEPADERRGSWMRVSEAIPVGDVEMTFPGLMRGRYAAAVVLADGTLLRSPTVVVGAKPATVELRDVTR